MKRLLLAALAALIAFAPAAGARGSSYVYIPVYIPVGPPMVPGADVGSYDKIHTVAVLSAIGTKFELEKEQFLSPKDGTLDIASWQVDQRVAETLKKYLGGKFTFTDVPYDPAKLAPILPTIWHAGQLATFLKTVPNDGIDAFIVIRPQGESGIQLSSGRYGQAVLWVRYEMDVVDAHTYKTIASSTSRLQFREGTAPQFPGRVLPDSFKLDDSLTVSAENQEKLHTITGQMLEYTLVETIRSLQFGVTLPPIGDHSIVPVKPDTHTAGVKSIAIVSALGDKAILLDAGGFFTKDERTDIPAADWGIDAEAEAMARDCLSQNYTLKNLPADRGVLGGQWWKGQKDELTVPVPPTQEVDAYLLILKDDTRNLNGIGLLHDSGLYGESTAAFANYVIFLVDAKTGKPITGQRAVMNAKSSRSNPVDKVSNAWWPKKGAAMTPEAVDGVRDTLRHLLADSIGETLYRMGLNLNTPAPAAAPVPVQATPPVPAPRPTPPPSPAPATPPG